jgi:hypothetical protein
LTQDLNPKEGFNIFKEWKFDKEDFEVLSKIKNRLGSGMKFELSDWIQIKGYSNSRQGFDLKDFSNLERCKPFQNRKVKIWS